MQRNIFYSFYFPLGCRALQEAQDIFGVDFNYEEFEQYEYEDDFDDEEVTVSLVQNCTVLASHGRGLSRAVVFLVCCGLFQSAEMNLAGFVLCQF